jgi:hypothetical protein
MKKMQKKAAVEMSLNLIIMLIIGIVVLGLVIGFVNNLVNQGQATYETQLSDNERLKLDEVSRCSDNLCIIPDPSIALTKGEQSNIFVKVRGFAGEISCTAGPLQACDTVKYTVVDNAGAAATAQFTLSGPGFEAPEGTQDAKMYTLTATSTVPLGTYYLTLMAYPDITDPVNPVRGTNTVTKTLTIQVE